jgi:hypothetical protein
LRERVGEGGAGEAEQGAEAGRQRAAAVEEFVDGVGNVLLVDGELRARAKLRPGDRQEYV